jgi:raffinose synthase
MYRIVKAGLVAVIVMAGLFLNAGARAGESGPLDQIRIVAPEAGAKVTVVKAKEGGLSAALIDYAGGPLPGESSIVLTLPAPAAARIFAAHIKPKDRHWSVPAWPASFAALPELTVYALWREDSGRYGAMIAMTGGGMITYLAAAPDGIKVTAHSYMDGFTPSRVPMVAQGFGPDPYQLTHDLYAFGLQTMREADPHGVIGRLREEKPYPDIFEYVGWCSWNAHYQNIKAADLIEHAASFKAAGFPIRYMIIDDGWEQLAANKDYQTQGRVNSLAGFEADPKKFPAGLAPVVAALKNDYGVTWVGVWHTLQGYWNGIDLDSDIGRQYADAILPVNPAVGVPDPRGDNGARFWDGYHGFMKNAGVDFVKTDDQSTMDVFIKNLVPIGAAYGQAQRNYHASVGPRFNYNVINCMSMNVDTVYQWEKTNIARVSGDYSPTPWHNPRVHTVTSVMNALWFGELTWPDYDMWQTYDQHREYHAVGRAISGGPVYITDKAHRERFQYLWPLVLRDGRLLRMDAPGRPARQSLFTDPVHGGRPLVAFARTGDSGALAVWNVDRFERPQTASLSPADVEGLAGERFAVYEHFHGELNSIAPTDAFSVKLAGWDVRLYSIVPIHDGFAPLGLTNKYVPPATVHELKYGPNRASFKLAEPGPLLAYSEHAPKAVKVDGKAIAADAITYSGNALKIDLSGVAASGKEFALEITW